MGRRSGYDFYLGKCLFPLAPEKLTVKIGNNNSTAVLMNDGEINILKQPKLTEIEFEALIPQVRYPFARYKSGFKKAEYFLSIFEKLKIARKPVQFIVCRRLPRGRKLYNTNMRVSLEEYQITESAKEGLDVKVKFKLKRYKFFGTKTVTIKPPAAPEAPPAASTEPPREQKAPPQETKTYTVRKGDCLWKIAKRLYGNGAQYAKIFEANRDKIKNPNPIYAGQVLTIPA